jgi:hypothetical protein
LQHSNARHCQKQFSQKLSQASIYTVKNHSFFFSFFSFYLQYLISA